MKYICTFILVIFFSSISAACSAEDVEEDVILIREDGSFGLGVVIADLDEDDEKELGISKGAKILEVLEDTEAERIGLKEKDVIVKFDDKDINTAEDLHNLVSDIEEEKEVDLEVYRDRKMKSYKGTLKEIKPRRVHIHVDGDDFDFDDLDFLVDVDECTPFVWHSCRKGGFLGINAKNISEQMLNYFEVEFGVLIEEVLEDQPAEKAGLKAGDVIVKINDRKIKDYDDLIRTLNFYDPGDKVKIEYVRKGKANKVEVELAKKEHTFKLPRIERPLRLKSFFYDDSSGNIRKEMKVIRKKLKNVQEKMKDIDIDLDFFII